MSFKQFLKDKLIYIILMIFALITCAILLIPFKIQFIIKTYIILAPFVMFAIGFFIEYFKKRNYYNSLKSNISELEEKYLIAEIIGNPNFAEGIILKEMLCETGKAMLENVNKYKYLQQDYKEYIELWIHEIKLPISVGKMVVENNKTEATESINEELDKIDNYVEQALYYARSNAIEKDYYIKKQNIKEIVNADILKNKRSLLSNKITYISRKDGSRKQ